MHEGQEEFWSLLWDERYKGRLGSLASAADAWWCAAIYTGVDFTKLADEENFKKVAALLRERRPLIRTYTDDETTLEQALASGELAAAMLLIFIPTVGDFVTPNLVGGSDGVMIANIIQAHFGKVNNWPMCAALAIGMMITVTVISLVYIWITRKVAERIE